MSTAPTLERTAAARGERIPPHDLDAEMAMLGSMMMSRDAIAEVIPIVSRADSRWMYLPVHQKLFEALLDIYDDATKAIDLIIVSDELRRRELLEFIGGHDYLIQLAESFADWSNAEYYARIIRDKGMLRDLIRCTSEISEHAFHGLDDARDVLDLAEQKLFAVTEQRIGGNTKELSEAVARLARQLRDGTPHDGLPTHFLQFDEMTGGMRPGDLVVLAGRPSMGKTALGLSMATNIAVHGHPTAFFSMEMSTEQVAERLLCTLVEGNPPIDLNKLRKRMLSEDDHYRLQSAAAAFQSVRLIMDDTAGMTIMELRSSARRMKQKFNIEAVFVDYLQLMHLPNAESRQVEISTISRGLKSLARELRIPVIALSQLNRMAEGRADKKPLMSDLRESGAIEQDADMVLLIHREEYYKPEDESVRNQAELIIAKQRNGPTGTVKLHFDKRRAHFDNHHEGPAPFTRDRGDDSSPF